MTQLINIMTNLIKNNVTFDQNNGTFDELSNTMNDFRFSQPRLYNLKYFVDFVFWCGRHTLNKYHGDSAVCERGNNHHAVFERNYMI